MTRKLKKVSVATIVVVGALAGMSVTVGIDIVVGATVAIAVAVGAAVTVGVNVTIGGRYDVVAELVGRILYVVLQLRSVAHAVGLRRRDVVVVIVGSSGVDGSRSIAGHWTSITRGGSWSVTMRRDLTRATASISSKTGLTLLDLALNATSIWSLANAGQDRAHSLDQLDAKVRRCELKGSLDDVVAVLIAHQLVQRLLMHHLLDHNGLVVHISAADALLNDIGAELLLR